MERKAKRFSVRDARKAYFRKLAKKLETMGFSSPHPIASQAGTTKGSGLLYRWGKIGEGGTIIREGEPLCVNTLHKLTRVTMADQTVLVINQIAKNQYRRMLGDRHGKYRLESIDPEDIAQETYLFLCWYAELRKLRNNRGSFSLVDIVRQCFHQALNETQHYIYSGQKPRYGGASMYRQGTESDNAWDKRSEVAFIKHDNKGKPLITSGLPTQVFLSTASRYSSVGYDPFATAVARESWGIADNFDPEATYSYVLDLQRVSKRTGIPYQSLYRRRAALVERINRPAIRKHYLGSERYRIRERIAQRRMDSDPWFTRPIRNPDASRIDQLRTYRACRLNGATMRDAYAFAMNPPKATKLAA